MPTASTRSCPPKRLRSSLRAHGRWPGELRVVLREAGAARERVLPDGAGEPLGEAHRSGPALGRVEARADDERRRRCAAHELGELGDRLGGDRRRMQQPGGCGRAGPAVADWLFPVAHRHDHERRAAPDGRLVVGPRDRAREPRSGAPAGSTTPGSRRRAARGSGRSGTGPSESCRRSCWPTRITSGTRLSRAQTIALTALPRPPRCGG